MSRTVTGPGRIEGLLPAGTPVAHKTGTIGGVANDVGYVALPDGRRFAVAIFTSTSTTPPHRPRRRGGRDCPHPLRFLRASVERAATRSDALVST